MGPRRVEPAVRRVPTRSRRSSPRCAKWEPRAALVGEGATEAIAHAAAQRAAAGRLARPRDGGGICCAGGRSPSEARLSTTCRRRRISRAGIEWSRARSRRDAGRGCNRRDSRRRASSSSRPTPSTASRARPDDEESVRTLSALKGRDPAQPIAIVFSSRRAAARVRSRARRGPTSSRRLLPGPYTLVVPNPARRYPWLAGSRPETIGVRVPDVAGPGRDVLEAVGVGRGDEREPPRRAGSAPRRRDVPEEIRSAVAAVVDGGELPGTPSTVLDLTGPEPRVLREGAVPAAEALAAAQ